jgi:hypothetical protein
MPTGYEVGMYRDLSLLAQAARRLVTVLERPAKDAREVALAAFRFGVQQGHSIGQTPQQQDAAFDRWYECETATGDGAAEVLALIAGSPSLSKAQITGKAQDWLRTHQKGGTA